VVAAGSDLTSDELKRLAASRPWAVVLAGQPTHARRMAAMLSALAPLLEHLPVLAFSSDLVFDGRNGPYVETDSTSDVPEGRAWCEWESALSVAVPHALVVRSGPWFDPTWRHDPLARALALLGRGEAVRLPEEERISPAYTPHLLHSALDLLADGEQGVWHLAPQASCSPFDLLRATAEHVGIRTHALSAGNVCHIGLARGGHSLRALSSKRGSVMPDLHLGVAEYAARFRARHVA
jgi:dTDP-4-dehydrorhamnose reductase